MAVTRRPVVATAVLSIFLFALSCINVNVPIGGSPSSAAMVWALERVPPDPWGVSSSYIIRIKDFSSVQELQRIEMVVLLADGTVNRASSDVWSARPMQLLSDHLAADLIDTGSWGAVLRTATMLREDFVVEGYIRSFGGVDRGESWDAVLDVDITVLDGQTNSLVFQKNYSLTRELSEPTYGELASVMSSLVGLFNEEVMGDIWSVMLPIR